MIGEGGGCRWLFKARRVYWRVRERGGKEGSERGTYLSRAYRARAAYLNGQSAAWAPRQPQWQHWGTLAWLCIASLVVTTLTLTGVDEVWV